jgi:hypothetical protein
MNRDHPKKDAEEFEIEKDSTFDEASYYQDEKFELGGEEHGMDEDEEEITSDEDQKRQ